MFISVLTLAQEAKKKVFRYNQTGGLTSIDPAFANKRSNIWGVYQVYHGLFRFEKGVDDIHLHPELARTWDISENGLVYTFRIKKRVFFHDNQAFPNGKGRELKASDFVYSFKRIINPETRSPGAWVFNDKVLREKDGSISDTCFKVIDDYTFRIYLDKKFPAFLNILSMPYCYVVPKEAVEFYGQDFGKNPVGTGPFMLESSKDWKFGQNLILNKNTNYWKKNIEHTGYLPYLDAIHITFGEDSDVAFRKFKKGKLDFISSTSSKAKSQILNKDGSIKKDFKENFKVFKIDYLNTEYIGFYMGDKIKNNPFKDNLKLRQALSYAINRQELLYLLRNGLGTPGHHGMIPKALPSYDTTLNGYKYDLQKAKNLLKEAGYPNGKGLPTLTLFTHTRDKNIARYLQKQWKNIGVNVDIEENQFPTHQAMVDNGKAMMFRGSWLGDHPDAMNYLELFYSKNFAPIGPNKTHFLNEEFDRLLEEVQESRDLFVKYDSYKKMDQIIMDNCPVIVLYYDELLYVTQKNVKGLELDQMGNLFLESVDIID